MRRLHAFWGMHFFTKKAETAEQNQVWLKRAFALLILYGAWRALVG